MLLIPSIDIKDGKCVRLRQGRMDEVTVFDDDPRDAARRWVDAGARRLHLVDLDGAVEGAPRNGEVIRALVSEFPDIDVQVGGGIRDDDTIEGYLATGARYVILGTRAVTTPGFVADACVEFPGHIIVGLDARDGRLAVDGWSKLTRFQADDFARRVEGLRGGGDHPHRHRARRDARGRERRGDRASAASRSTCWRTGCGGGSAAVPRRDFEPPRITVPLYPEGMLPARLDIEAGSRAPQHLALVRDTCAAPALQGRIRWGSSRTSSATKAAGACSRR